MDILTHAQLNDKQLNTSANKNKDESFLEIILKLVPIVAILSIPIIVIITILIIFAI